MGAHSFFWQRVRAVRHTKNMGAINGLNSAVYLYKWFFMPRLYVVNVLVKNSPWLLKIISHAVSVKVAIKSFQNEMKLTSQNLRLTCQKFIIQ